MWCKAWLDTKLHLAFCRVQVPYVASHRSRQLLFCGNMLLRVCQCILTSCEQAEGTNSCFGIPLWHHSCQQQIVPLPTFLRASGMLVHPHCVCAVLHCRLSTISR